MSRPAPDPELVFTSGTEGMRRASRVRPGWDCLVKCEHVPPQPQQHGQHGDEWNYYVVAADDRAAISLFLMTGYRHGKPVAGWPIERVTGADLSLHVTWPTDEDAIRSGDTGRDDCDLVKPCFTGWTSGFAAQEFHEAHHTGGVFDQLEPFWLALEKRLIKLRGRVEDRSAVARCPPHCAGSRLVPTTIPTTQNEGA